jgi:hypothetical protein
MRALLTRLETWSPPRQGASDVIDLAVRGTRCARWPRHDRAARCCASEAGRALHDVGRGLRVASATSSGSGTSTTSPCRGGRRRSRGDAWRAARQGARARPRRRARTEHAAELETTPAEPGHATAHGDDDANGAPVTRWQHPRPAAKDLPILDWAAAPGGETAAPKHEAAAHEDGHAAVAEHDAHDAQVVDDAAPAHDEHAAAGAHAVPSGHDGHTVPGAHDNLPGATPALRWTDPTVLTHHRRRVAAAAAVLAMQKR